MEACNRQMVQYRASLPDSYDEKKLGWPESEMDIKKVRHEGAKEEP